MTCSEAPIDSTGGADKPPTRTRRLSINAAGPYWPSLKISACVRSAAAQFRPRRIASAHHSRTHNRQTPYRPESCRPDPYRRRTATLNRCRPVRRRGCGASRPREADMAGRRPGNRTRRRAARLSTGPGRSPRPTKRGAGRRRTERTVAFRRERDAATKAGSQHGSAQDYKMAAPPAPQNI